MLAFYVIFGLMVVVSCAALGLAIWNHQNTAVLLDTIPSTVYDAMQAAVPTEKWEKAMEDGKLDYKELASFDEDIARYNVFRAMVESVDEANEDILGLGHHSNTTDAVSLSRSELLGYIKWGTTVHSSVPASLITLQENLFEKKKHELNSRHSLLAFLMEGISTTLNKEIIDELTETRKFKSPFSLVKSTSTNAMGASVDTYKTVFKATLDGEKWTYTENGPEVDVDEDEDAGTEPAAGEETPAAGTESTAEENPAEPAAEPAAESSAEYQQQCFLLSF
jgi:hypothetical protein